MAFRTFYIHENFTKAEEKPYKSYEHARICDLLLQSSQTFKNDPVLNDSCLQDVVSDFDTMGMRGLSHEVHTNPLFPVSFPEFDTCAPLDLSAALGKDGFAFLSKKIEDNPLFSQSRQTSPRAVEDRQFGPVCVSMTSSAASFKKRNREEDLLLGDQRVSPPPPSFYGRGGGVAQPPPPPPVGRGGGGGQFGSRGGGGAPRGFRPPAARDDDGMEEESGGGQPSDFKTGLDQFRIDQATKNKRRPGGPDDGSSYHISDNGSMGSNLVRNTVTGAVRANPLSGGRKKFVTPFKSNEQDGAKQSGGGGGGGGQQQQGQGAGPFGPFPGLLQLFGDVPDIPEELHGIDLKLADNVANEVLDQGASTSFADIAGLQFQKESVREMVIWPLIRPDVFTGTRAPSKGLLLFGPPGTGKTLIGKAIATEVRAVFFNISASSLMSKWVGEGEKMVRALFAVASAKQPSVIFIDEIDSLLCQRSETDMEGSRRVKTEFLVQLDGAGTKADKQVIIIGATNRPQELDEAARRRLMKRLYIPLPEREGRMQLIQRMLKNTENVLSEEDMQWIIEKSEGYSGADLSALVREAALEPIRAIEGEKILTISKDEIPPVSLVHFQRAFSQVRASVSQHELSQYIEWNDKFGSKKIDV